MALALATAMALAAATPAWGAGALPLRAGDGALVADGNTRLVVTCEQCPDTKLITATLQIENNSGTDCITVQAIAAALSFDERVAPYAWGGGAGQIQNPIFGYGKSVADGAEFGKYCRALPYLGENGYGDQIYFDTFGSQYIRRDGGGGAIGAKIGKPAGDTNPDLVIAPGQTAGIAEFYFMPVNGEDSLDIGMIGHCHERDPAELIWATPMIAYGATYLAASPEGMRPEYACAISPGSFKVHVRRPLPVGADNAGRAVAGYDAGTMEWSYEEGGPYENGAPAVKHEAHSIYVRGKEDAGYSGGDAIFGDYKKYVHSEARVDFAENAAPADYGAVDAALAAAGALDRQLYTKASLAAVDAATAAVEHGLGIAQQAAVDGFAAAIDAAIGSLAEREPITSIQIDSPALTPVVRGQTYAFSVTLNQGADDDDIAWTVSSQEHAKVNANKTVTILNKTGTAALTATDPISGLSASITLKIP